MNPSQDFLGERDVKGRLMNLLMRSINLYILLSKELSKDIGAGIIDADEENRKEEPEHAFRHICDHGGSLHHNQNNVQ